MHFAIDERRVNRAFITRVGRPIGMRMVMHVVRALTGNVFVPPAQNPGRCDVAECDTAVAVQPVNPLARRVENELVMIVQLGVWGIGIDDFRTSIS